MEYIRAFIAIELPDGIKSELDRLQAQLKAGRQHPVKWVNPYGIHLTLKFLGNIAADKTGEITRAIETATRGVPPLHLEIRDLGVFPNLKRVRVAWVGVGGDLAQLGQIQQRIESNMARLGFAPESRSFTPHLTLARLQEQASPDEQQSFGQLITSTRFEAIHGFDVDSINLIKSQLTREGAIYSRISSIKLKKTLSTTTN
jgi:2'-5' RNA ligase